MFLMRAGSVDENSIDLIKFCDALTLGYRNKASKSNLRIKLWIEDKGTYFKGARENIFTD